MTEIFNNREISIIIWLAVFFLFAFIKKDLRESFGKIVSTFFSKGIINVVLLMIVYNGLVILGLTLLKFWETPLLKDSIFWLAFIGFPLLMKTDKINSENNYLNFILKDSIKGIVILEFITNFYNFSLTMELILIPTMTIVGISQVLIKDKYAKRFFNIITSIFGVTVLAYTIYRIYNGFEEFANLITLKSFLLPIILTVFYLSFLYLVALWDLYRTMIIRVGSRLKKVKHKKYLKKKMYMTFLLNRKKLRKFQKEMGFEPIMNKKDINQTLKKFIKKE